MVFECLPPDPIKRPPYPQAMFGWIAVNGQPAPVGTKIELWDKTKQEYLFIQETWNCSYNTTTTFGFYDIIFWGVYAQTRNYNGDTIEIYVNGEYSGYSFIYTEWEVWHKNLNVGSPKIQLGGFDILFVDTNGNPINGELGDIEVDLYLVGYGLIWEGWWGIDENGHSKMDNLLPGDYFLHFINLTGRWITPPDYYFTILPGQKHTDTIIVEGEPITPTKGHIISYNAPSSAYAGQGLVINFSVQNIGNSGGFIRTQLIDADTGESIGGSWNIWFDGGEIKNLYFNRTMPNKDWNLKIITGYGGIIDEETPVFTIKLSAEPPEKKFPWLLLLGIPLIFLIKRFK